MREIKFRAWQAGTMYSWADIRRNLYEHLIHPEIAVMQYTGLHDKNGKEIYEGDVVVVARGSSLTGSRPVSRKPSRGRYEVIWHEGAFKIYKGKRKPNYHLTGMMVRWVNLRVSGNIYENPELLEAK